MVSDEEPPILSAPFTSLAEKMRLHGDDRYESTDYSDVQAEPVAPRLNAMRIDDWDDSVLRDESTVGLGSPDSSQILRPEDNSFALSEPTNESYSFSVDVAGRTGTHADGAMHVYNNTLAVPTEADSITHGVFDKEGRSVSSLPGAAMRPIDTSMNTTANNSTLEARVQELEQELFALEQCLKHAHSQKMALVSSNSFSDAPSITKEQRTGRTHNAPFVSPCLGVLHRELKEGGSHQQQHRCRAARCKRASSSGASQFESAT